MIGLSVEQLLEPSRTRIIYTFKLVFVAIHFTTKSVQITCIVVYLLFVQYYTKGGCHILFGL